MLDVKVAIEKGFDPIKFYDIIGKELTRNCKKEETIKAEDVVDFIIL